MKVTDVVREIAEPIVAQQGCSLWDVEYVREGGEWFLRIYIDRPDGVDIDDCEAISRAMDPILDEKDPVPDSYHFEVCSAGLERTLKTPEHFAAFLGSKVLVKLYKPLDGSKEFVGTLEQYDPSFVTIQTNTETRSFDLTQVALVRLWVDF